MSKVPYRPTVKQMLADIGDTLGSVVQEKLGIDNKAAQEIGEAAAIKFARNWCGVTIYIPRAIHIDEQHWAIYNEFNGSNVKELALKHQVSEQWIYDIIKRMRSLDLARRQPDLFSDQENQAGD